MSKTIEIIVSPDGQSHIETKGFAGSNCREASKFIEQALGERISDTPTSEFYHSSRTATENLEQN